MATLAATRNKQKNISAIYNYGTPRVGRFEDSDFPCPIYRVTNAKDPIPEVPVRLKGRYKHAGIELQFAENNGIIHPVYEDKASEEIKEAAREFFGHFSDQNMKDKGFLRSYIESKISAHRMSLYIDNLTSAFDRTLIA